MTENRPSILIIDEDESFCRYLSEHLKHSNFFATYACGREEASRHLQKQSVQAVVLSHNLPGTDGLRLLSEIRAQNDPPPVVYLTGDQESQIAVAAVKAGAADYLMKNIDSDFLVLLENAVRTAIYGAVARRAKELAEEEVRSARDKFEALAEERALLLREVNHRVSNSLQLIASLLHFQADMSGNADVKAALKEANGRVLAVARVHRSLYTSHDVRWVSLADYLNTLIHDLEDVSAGAEHRGEISLAADRIQARPDAAVSVGIVATELVINALKHAYPNGQGPVRVRLLARESHIELTVEDDGIGSGDGDSSGRRSGLGQRIISGMADKLAGEVRYTESTTGTQATLSFPISDEIRLPPSAAQISPAA
jgi:two-component sensor histidine kinase